MDVRRILTELKHERDRLNRAIAILDEIDTTPAPINSFTNYSSSRNTNQKYGLTPAARKHLSAVMKKRWAERRKKSS